MKTKKNLVKQVLMSIVTVVTVFGFTACSEDTLEESYGMAEKKAAADKSMSIGRTILIYMAGKNDLTHNNSHRNYVNEDLEEIKEGSRKLSTTSSSMPATSSAAMPRRATISSGSRRWTRLLF